MDTETSGDSETSADIKTDTDTDTDTDSDTDTDTDSDTDTDTDTDTDNSDAVAAAAAITVTNIEDVRGNLTLQDTSNSLPVTWSSDNPSIVSTDGIVNRPSSDTVVELTATVVDGEITANRTFSAQVRAAVKLASFEGYAFAYFTGNTINGEKIYFAASRGNDALTWDELNGGQPIFSSIYGTTGLRDPFIIRSPEGDTFYMVATDLSIGSGTSWDEAQRQGSLYLEVWESHDLITWSEQRHVKVSPDNAGNTWAPEAYYDETLESYVVFWASKLYDEDDPNHEGSTYNRMLYATTRDFVTFSDPQIWQDGISRIDSTVIKVDDLYHRFTKDEGAGTTGCSDIIQETSSNLLAPLDDWTMIDSCIGNDAGTSAVEGPSIFKSNPDDINGDYYYLFVDEYGDRGYIPLRTDDINNPSWVVAPSYDLPAAPRHGTVIPVTADELDSLQDLIEVIPEVEANEQGEIVRYDFETYTDSTLTDVSGNGKHGTIEGNPTFESGELILDGEDDFIDMPDNLLSGVHDVSVEAEVYIDSSQETPYFIWGIGNTTSDIGDGYLFTTGDNYRTSIATGNWSTEQTVIQDTALSRDTFLHLAYTLEDTTATLYLNGAKVASGTVTLDPTDINGGSTSANYLGRSMYTSDHLFKGRFREFVLYNRALSPEEVLTHSGNTTLLTSVSLSNTDVLEIDPIVDSELHTVVFVVKEDTDVSQMAPVFITSDSVVSSPSSGTVVDLSSPVDYTLSDGTTETVWTMSAVEKRTPILPGLYADPNAVAFGNKYYIYPTTDGYDSWGGKDFYVWSSTNLVDWTRSEEPILTLDGENGDVPWATGNAWAPTIIERDGKYYFYFSGNNPTYDRKTIGVAVADSPEGPFTAESTAMILNNEDVTTGQAIDPAAFQDPETGKYYLFWGNGSPPLYAELSDDMTSIVPDTIASISNLSDFREGMFVSYRDGLYHLTYAIDDTGSANYRVGYASASSVHGPWTSHGVILSKDPSLGILGTGHASVLNVPGTDDWYIVYHRFAIPDGGGTQRETTIDVLTFDSETGLMEVVTPTLTGVDPQEIASK